MQWGRTISLGIAIWLIIFVVTSVLRDFEIYGSLVARLPLAWFSGFLSYWLTGRLRPRWVKTALGYGFTWVVINLIFDLVFARPFNPAMFASEWQWFSYSLILVLPVLALDKTKKEPGVSSLTVD